MTSHLMEEGSTSEHHGELARVVGVVQPGLMGDVPRVVAPWEANDAVPCLSPDTANTKSLSMRHTPRGPVHRSAWLWLRTTKHRTTSSTPTDQLPREAASDGDTYKREKFSNCSCKEQPTQVQQKGQR